MTQRCAREDFSLGGDAHPNEPRMAAKANRVRNLEGTAVRRGRGGKEKEWVDCVQNDVLAFDIASEWKATAVGKGVWFETVTERGRGLWPRGENKR